MRPEKTFNVGLYNAILEPKHYRAMGDSLWLYTYLLDRQGRRLDKDGLGKVAGGVPIRDSDVGDSLGSSRRTVIRWREVLLRHGYIAARRTPYGYVYAIAKPKKWSGKPNSSKTDVTQTVHLSSTDVTQTDKRCDIPCTNKEEEQRVTVVVEREASKETATTVSKNQMEGELLAAWNSYLEAFDKEEILSPSRKRTGLETLRKLRERFPEITSEQCVGGMTSAINRVHHLVKTQPKKAYLADWFKIFGNFGKFLEYWTEDE